MSLHALSIVNIMLILLYTTHVFACAWYFIGFSQREEGKSNWIDKHGIIVVDGSTGTVTHDAAGASDVAEGDTAESSVYVRCLYWALLSLMMSTSDVAPTCDLERAFAMCVMLEETF